MEKKCPVCWKSFAEGEQRWGIKKVGGTWKASPRFSPSGGSYHQDCANDMAEASNT